MNAIGLYTGKNGVKKVGKMFLSLFCIMYADNEIWLMNKSFVHF